jgi:pyruvate kinase
LKCLQSVREAVKITNKNCAIMLDTKGPEIRTGFLVEKQVELKKN